LSNQTVGSISRIPVPSVDPSMPITKVASIMTKQNIGAILVARDYELLGIVTESDIVDKVALGNIDDLVAQDLMAYPVITIGYERTIQDALEIMKNNDIRRLVVVKDKFFFGLVTERRLLIANFSRQNNK
jgi:CBS domain-containing protein